MSLELPIIRSVLQSWTSTITMPIRESSTGYVTKMSCKNL